MNSVLKRMAMTIYNKHPYDLNPLERVAVLHAAKRHIKIRVPDSVGLCQAKGCPNNSEWLIASPMLDEKRLCQSHYEQVPEAHRKVLES